MFIRFQSRFAELIEPRLIEEGRLLFAEGDSAAGAGGAGAGVAGDAGAGGGENGGAAAGAAGGAGGEGGGAGDPPSWPEDWRARLAGGDDKELQRLQRVSDPSQVWRSYRQLEGRISSGQLKPIALPEHASAEEIAQYRRDVGVPETPDGYELGFPEGVTPTDQDKADLSFFAKAMHDAHMPPAAVKAAFTAFNGLVEQAAQRTHDRLQELAVAAQAQLRNEWGRDYARNKTITNDFLGEAFTAANKDGATLGPKVLDWTLSDGTKLGDHPEFVRTMNYLAHQMAGDDVLLAGEPGGGKSVQSRIDELVTKSAQTRLSASEDAELTQLYEKKVAIEERTSRRAA